MRAFFKKTSFVLINIFLSKFQINSNDIKRNM